MAKAKKEVEVIDMGGAKTVAKKKSLVRGVKLTITLITVVWFVILIWTPLYVKNTYSEPIKKSIVVSMFFDLQRGIVKQYEALLDGVAKSVNLEKPIAKAVDAVKGTDLHTQQPLIQGNLIRTQFSSARSTPYSFHTIPSATLLLRCLRS